MILRFSRDMPWGNPTKFRQKIQGTWHMLGTKHHTFRKGKRWQPGNKIHFWEESPRNPGKSPVAFNLAHPQYAAYWWDVQQDRIIDRGMIPRYEGMWPAKHEEYIPVVYAVEEYSIAIVWNSSHPEYMSVVVGGKQFFDGKLSDYSDPDAPGSQNMFPPEFKLLTLRDGFYSPMHFINWFSRYGRKGETTILEGQVIHWDDQYLYHPLYAKIFKP